MNTIWNVRADPDRTIPNPRRIFSFTMVLGIGFVLLVSLMLSTLLASFGNFVGGLLSEAEILLLIVNFVISF